MKMDVIITVGLIAVVATNLIIMLDAWRRP